MRVHIPLFPGQAKEPRMLRFVGAGLVGKVRKELTGKASLKAEEE
jgi:hypothetical protein